MLLNMALFAAALAIQPAPLAPPPPPPVIHEIDEAWGEEEAAPIRPNCPVPRPGKDEHFVLLGFYEGSAVADHAVAGLDELTTTGAITISPGSGHVFLVLTSYEAMIYRISGSIERLSRVVILHPKGGGVTGVDAAKVSFGIGYNCDFGNDAASKFAVSNAELLFGRPPDRTGNMYDLHEWTVGTRDAGFGILPPDHDFDPKATHLEEEMIRFFPGGVIEIDPKSLVSSRTAERYRVLPSTAGAVQLERSRMIVPASREEMEASKGKAIQRYGRQEVGSISTYQAYRVVKPIEVPIGLCGAHLLTFLVPSEEYLRGDPCHSDIITADGRVLKADRQAQLRLIEMKSPPVEASKLSGDTPAAALSAPPQKAGPASPAKLPEQEARIQSTLGLAVEKIRPTIPCDLPELRQSDFLTVVGAYRGETVPTVTVAGQDEESSVADVIVGKGANPVYLVLSSYDPVIWRMTGDVGRVRQLIVFHQKSAGVIGIPARKIHFSDDNKCRIPYDVYEGRQLEDDVAVLATFGRRANAIGGNYSLHRATLNGDTLKVDRVPKKPSEDLVLTNQPADPIFPKGKGNGPSTLEREFHLRFPAGIASIDPRSVVATGSVERYEVLPITAGAFQLEQEGALVPATAADVRRWKDRAIIGGHVRADRIKSLHFYSAYRVTRPIRIPSGLCGGYSLTFFVPSRDYVKGDPCHSNIYVDDGTIMAGS